MEACTAAVGSNGGCETQGRPVCCHRAGGAGALVHRAPPKTTNACTNHQKDLHQAAWCRYIKKQKQHQSQEVGLDYRDWLRVGKNSLSLTAIEVFGNQLLVGNHHRLQYTLHCNWIHYWPLSCWMLVNIPASGAVPVNQCRRGGGGHHGTSPPTNPTSTLPLSPTVTLGHPPTQPTQLNPKKSKIRFHGRWWWYTI